MAAGNTDKFRKGKSKFKTTLAAPGIDNVTGTIPLTTVAGLPTDTAVEIRIDRVNSSGTKTPATEESIVGVVDVGNSRLINGVRGKDGTAAQPHLAGAVVEIIWSAQMVNDMVDGFVAEHNQDGTHKQLTGLTNNTFVSAKNNAGSANVNVWKVGTDDKLHFDYAGAASELLSGWQPADEIWTYATPTTVTVPGDVTGKYAKGDKVRLKQGGSYLYFYILTTPTYSPSITTLTLSGGTDYTLANAGITSNYYSKSVSPGGFPVWFNWAPVPTGFSSVAVNIARFMMTAGNILGTLDISGTSSATSFGLNLPAPSKTAHNRLAGRITDNGTLSYSGMISYNTNSISANLSTSPGGAGWTNPGTKECSIDFSYEPF